MPGTVCLFKERDTGDKHETRVVHKQAHGVLVSFGGVEQTTNTPYNTYTCVHSFKVVPLYVHVPQDDTHVCADRRG